VAAQLQVTNLQCSYMYLIVTNITSVSGADLTGKIDLPGQLYLAIGVKLVCKWCSVLIWSSASGGNTLLERRWRCVQHFLFSCKASPLGCPDPYDLWGFPCPLRQWLAQTSFWRRTWNPSIRIPFSHCMPWVLDHFCVLQCTPVRVLPLMFF
jgi:hypothetical protein